MTPSVIAVETSVEIPRVTKSIRTPLKSSGSLNQFEKVDLTTVIGTEFAKGVQLTDLLNAPNSDDLIRDLAILGIYDTRFLLC